jgi:hypothetical protein
MCNLFKKKQLASSPTLVVDFQNRYLFASSSAPKQQSDLE